jgi:predicted PurR-regulated permease PerM
VKKKVLSPVSPSLSTNIKTVLFAYAKAQLLVAAAVTLILYIILSLLDVSFPLLLSFFSGAVSVIPVFGLWIAAIVAGMVATFDNIRFIPNLPEIFEGIAIFLIYLTLNFFLDFLLAPYLVGKTVKIPPLVILISVILGTAAFGIPGAIMAVPIVLVIKTVLDYQPPAR